MHSQVNPKAQFNATAISVKLCTVAEYNTLTFLGVTVFYAGMDHNVLWQQNESEHLTDHASLQNDSQNTEQNELFSTWGVRRSGSPSGSLIIRHEPREEWEPVTGGGRKQDSLPLVIPPPKSIKFCHATAFSIPCIFFYHSSESVKY